jgi:hypothetical protein
MKPRSKEPKPRELALYDGRLLLGTIIVRGKQYQAVAADGAPLGEFSNQKLAIGAITAISSGSSAQPAEMNTV